MTRVSRTLAVLATALLGGHALAAQSPRTGRLEGTVYDSLTAKPLAGAAVTVMQLAPDPQQYHTATTDASGRWAVDSLVAGRYTVGFTTPFLDSLEVQFPPREVMLTESGRLRLDFATPSRATLAAAACRDVPLPLGRGAVVGQVMNADSDMPLAGATVAVSWTDVSVDLKALKPVAVRREAVFRTDAAGQYRLCGVPTDTYILLQVQDQGRSGTVVRTSVPDAGAVMVQNLSLSVTTARTLASTDSLGTAGGDTAMVPLAGTASLTGTVVGPDGHPLPDAQVRVLDAIGSARSDATGQFTLSGLPAGTQVLEARRVGYLLGHQVVDLRAGRTVASDVRLSRIVTLDSVRIIAQRSRLSEFERRAGRGSTAGTIIRAEEIERQHASVTSDLLRQALGFSIVGDGIDAKVRSSRGQVSLNLECLVNIVIDNIQHQDINLVPPGAIAGMEIYRGPAGAPPQYDSACGVIVIWTKR